MLNVSCSVFWIEIDARTATSSSDSPRERAPKTAMNVQPLSSNRKSLQKPEYYEEARSEERGARSEERGARGGQM